MEKKFATGVEIRAAIDARRLKDSELEIKYRIFKITEDKKGRNFQVEVENSSALGVIQVTGFLEEIVSVVSGEYQLI